MHSRGGGGAPLSQSPQPSIPAPTPSFIRTDIDVPVLTFETESDLILLGFLPARQPDTRRIRLWEVAGTSHYDTYGLIVGPDDPGPAALDTTYLPPTNSAFGGIISCALPVNAGPQHYVLSAALYRLHRWSRAGRAQGASAPRLEITGDPPTIARDAHGNALGGIRTAQVDVPVAALSGLGQSGGAFCSIFGTTTPFDAATLATLYPSHEAYVSARAGRDPPRGTGGLRAEGGREGDQGCGCRLGRGELIGSDRPAMVAGGDHAHRLAVST